MGEMLSSPEAAGREVRLQGPQRSPARLGLSSWRDPRGSAGRARWSGVYMREDM